MCVRNMFVKNSNMFANMFGSVNSNTNRTLTEQFHELFTNARRYRYIEAYQVDCNLQKLEEDFISKTHNDEISYKVRSMSHWRKILVKFEENNPKIPILSEKQEYLSSWRMKMIPMLDAGIAYLQMLCRSQSVDSVPDILKKQLKTGNSAEVGVFPENASAQLNLSKVQEPIFDSLLFKASQLQWRSNPQS
ncbi:hypothetical protein OROMI_020744 [Orobanche minor]